MSNFRLEVSIPTNDTVNVCGLSIVSDSTNNVVGPSPLATPVYYGTPSGNYKATWDMQNIGVFSEAIFCLLN